MSMLVPIRRFYVIRWNRMESLGREACEDAPWYSYIQEVRVGECGRGVDTDPRVDCAIKFSSWAEAAAVATFIIHYIDELYEDALEVVKIDS